MKIIIKRISALTGRLRRNDSGATAIEYSLIVALLSAMIVGSVGAVGTKLGDRFGMISVALQGPPPTRSPRNAGP